MSIKAPSLNHEINQVLAQMRALQAELGTGPRPPAAAGTETAGAPSFTQVLSRAINQVNTEQQTAQAMVQGFETGTSNASLAEVMIQMQKSSLAFEGMTQVRNRLVDAYQEIMNMPI
jgi:flagellar hook-basal body complex protein FliE